jgi:hypothetical protein
VLERLSLERELAELGAREFQIAPPGNDPTVGFEFDVHFGLIEAVIDDAGMTMPADGAQITDHDETTDGFRVKREGAGPAIARIEIATKPFRAVASGKAEFDQTIANVLKLARELRQGCETAAQKSIVVKNNNGADVQGKPRPFTHPKTTPGGLPLARLPFENRFDPRNCSVWAAPQATLAVPLAKVGALITEIRRTEGQPAGIALTGARTQRMGLRSDALFRALAAVDQARTQIVRRRPRLVLGDGTEVNETTFSASLRGFLILLASYLWTSELKYEFDKPSPANPRDYEPFGKAYLPINVKAPFSEIFAKLLSPAEQRVFREIFADGAARERLFRLARPGATLADGTRKLLPPGPKELGLDSVHERQKAEFGSIPSWNDLVDHTLDPTHKGWGDRLMVPLSKTIGIDRTKPGVALELRRIGFNAVFAKDWAGLMRRTFTLASKLNA